MKVKSFLGGSLFSASLAGMSCCKTSLLLALVGLGSSGLAMWLVRYRGWLLGFTLALLAIAFYMVYRPRPASAQFGEGQAACASRMVSRSDKLFLWIATLTIAGVFTFPYYGPHLAAGKTVPATPPAPQTVHENIELQVNGMMCLGCRATCREAILRIAGVQKVEFDETRDRFIISGEPGRISTKDLIGAVEQKGFKVASFSRAPSGP